MKHFLVRSCRWLVLLVLLTMVQHAVAQQPPAIPIGPGGNQGNQGNFFGGPQQGLGLGAGQQGGAAAADFDSLIDLIESTVAPDTWTENGTGEGDVQPFPTGVYADAGGTLRFAKPTVTPVALGQIPKRATENIEGDVRASSELRYVSLPRLEAAIRDRQLHHQPLDEAMLTLAGLQRVQYVFVSPPTDDQPGDLVIAGPAGDWQVRPDGKIVSVETGQPVVRLDDLLTLWRRHLQLGGKAFGVSINPRQENLAKVQQYVSATGARPLEPGQRREWIEGLQASLGTQDVEFFGLEPNSHVARVLLVADYHMKLIGMGLADGVDGVKSYLKTVRVDRDGSVPPMTVLRWWFAMQYEPVATTADREVFQLSGPGAKVLSENELLAARGQRVHTGQSEDLNRQFASSFSQAFEQICDKYPLYTELRNVFDLSMVLALVEQENLLSRAAWQPVLFTNDEWLPLPKMQVPTEVETVVNHRVIRKKHIIAGISGGVWIDTQQSMARAKVSAELTSIKAAPEADSANLSWWWD